MLGMSSLSPQSSVNPYQYQSSTAAVSAEGSSILATNREAVTATAGNQAATAGTSAQPEMAGVEECETCKSRKYQDGSNDPGVSFKTPTHVSRAQSGAAVRAHEGEHVNREQAKAEREDREVVSQSVQIHTSVCPECGKSYVSDGTTRTTTRSERENPQPAAAASGPGQVVDRYA